MSKETKTFIQSAKHKGGYTHESEAYTEDGGLTWRWTSNDRYPFPDDMEKYDDWEFDRDAQEAARDEETQAFLKEYRENYTVPSEEERFEARAAHGEGVTLVNIFTGHRWTT